MTATLSPFPVFRAFDSNGAPLDGGKLFTYQAGTSTPLATYTDQGGLTANTNPVVLDSSGQANVWLGSSSYKMVLQDKDGNPQWSVDNIQDSGATVLADLASTSAGKGAALVGMKRSATNSIATTVYNWINGQVFNLKTDFGALADGSDETSLIQGALNQCAGKTLYIPSGTYTINGRLTLLAGTRLVGDGYNSTIIYQSEANQGSIVTNNDNEICYLRFTGTGAYDTDHQGNGTIFNDPTGAGLIGKRIHIHDCYFDTTISVSAMAGNSWVDAIIEDNHIEMEKGEHGIYLSGGSIRCWVKNNYIRKTNSTATSCSAINMKGISSSWIEDNFISGTGWTGYGIVTSTANSNDVQIRNNRFYGIDSTVCVPIRVGSAADDTYMVVAGNDIEGGYYGVQCSAAHTLVESNIIRNTTYNAIYADATGRDASYTTIQDNKIYSCGGGIRLVAADDYTYVLNNTVTSGTGVGIEWYSGSSIGFVGGNRVENNSTNYSLLVAVPSDCGTSFTPAFTGLTETPGSGSIEMTGTYWIHGNIVEFVINILHLGNATTQSIAGTTWFAPAYGTPTTYATANVISPQSFPSTSNLGLATALSNNYGEIFTPAWAANGYPITIRGTYSI